MHFVKSNRAQVEKMIRRTMSGGMNLIMIASFIAAPTSMVLFPPLSFAAPVPAPPAWIAEILLHLKQNGELSQLDIFALKEKGKSSYVTIRSIVNRINHYLALQNSPFRLVPTAVLLSDTSKIDMTVTLVNINTKKNIEDVEFGIVANDERPMEETSLPVPTKVSE